MVVFAKDLDKCKGLKEALGVGGWRLHSLEEWAKEIREAEKRGRREATFGNDPVDLEPLVLKEAPEVRVVGSVSSPCPPGSLTSPAVLENESADLPPNTTTSLGKDSTPPPPPPLYITSTFKGSRPQTIVLHAGGAWGIRITQYRD